MLITFEGIDGSGKSTQIALLKKSLSERGWQVEVFREPGGTEVSELIRQILLDPALDVHPIAELLLFSAARAQLTTQRVRPLLEAGTIVILDRFYDSTVSYQGYGRQSLPIDVIHQINNIATQHLVPDITFYLRLPLQEAARRTQHSSKDRMEQAGDEFFRKVIEGFDTLARQNPRFRIINSMQGIEEAQRQILEMLQPELDKKANATAKN